MSTELYASATATVAAIRAREVSALEIARFANEIIEDAARDQTSSGIATATPELALAQAQSVSTSLHDAYLRGFAPIPHHRGLGDTHGVPASTSAHGHAPAGEFSLAGLPVAVKDLFPVAGVACTMGSEHLAYTPDQSCAPVKDLLRRGAIIPATTHTSEMGLTAYTEPIGLPAPENPLFPGCTPGGSSGGSAVAVARGLVAASLGSDGGGSIRIPAACCGIIGLKPAHNIYGGRLSTPAFLTRTLADAALLAKLPAPQHDGKQNHHYRVGVTVEPFHADVTVAQRWKQAALTAADRLSDAGHDVVEVPSPYELDGRIIFDVFSQIMSYFSAALPAAHYSEMVQWIRERGRSVSKEQAINCQAFRLSLPEHIQSRWHGIDAVITPTLASDPPPIGYFSSMRPEDNFYAQTDWTPWLSLWNLTGWAGLAVPFDDASIHIGAVHGTEATLLNLASDLKG